MTEEQKRRLAVIQTEWEIRHRKTWEGVRRYLKQDIEKVLNPIKYGSFIDDGRHAQRRKE